MRITPPMLLTALLLLPAAAAAESPPIECACDSECDAGMVCIASGTCIPESNVCGRSADCASGQICDFRGGACAASQCGGEARCDQPQGWCTTPPAASDACNADTDCPEDKLCWLAFTPTCAADDPACDALPNKVCVDYGTFCELDDAPGPCSAQDTCVNGRCIPPGYEAQAMSIAIDTIKERRLASEWRAAIDALGGCTTTAASDYAWLALVGLGLAFRRRR